VVSSVLSVLLSYLCFLGYSKGISVQNGTRLSEMFLPRSPKSTTRARAQRLGACIDFNALIFIAAFNQMIFFFNRINQ